ncbi:unnamed protein product [Urochloa humidicola]
MGRRTGSDQSRREPLLHLHAATSRRPALQQKKLRVAGGDMRGREKIGGSRGGARPAGKRRRGAPLLLPHRRRRQGEKGRTTGDRELRRPASPAAPALSSRLNPETKNPERGHPGVRARARAWR